MATDPRMIRASDADRDRTAALLREHHAVGRLTAEEFHERLDRAYEAKTIGELEDLLSDLPAIDLYELPDAALRRPRPGPSGSIPLPWLLAPFRAAPLARAAWRASLMAGLVLFAAWLATGRGANVLLWAAVPWGLVLVGRRLGGGGRDRRRR